MFLIYLLESTGLKTDVSLVPVLVRLDSHRPFEVHVKNDFTDWFLASVVEARTAESNRSSCHSATLLEQAIGEAAEYLEMIRADEERGLKAVNETLINTQIDSITQSTRLKTDRGHETIDKLMSQGKEEADSIVRLYRGRVGNLFESTVDRVSQLNSKKQVSVAFDLIAGGIVQVDNEAS